LRVGVGVRVGGGVGGVGGGVGGVGGGVGGVGVGGGGGGVVVVVVVVVFSFLFSLCRLFRSLISCLWPFFSFQFLFVSFVQLFGKSHRVVE
jgi:hypothetical protein